MKTTINLVNAEQEISINEVVSIYKLFFKFLKKSLLIITLISLLGAVLGFLYAKLEKPKYLAKSTFVLESDNKGGLGQYAGLASFAGIDMGSSGGDIFQSDNIIELYKSRAMIAKTLLSKAESGGETLIERYITANNLRDKWKSKSELKNINFEGNPTKFSRLKDSIINDLVNVFNKQYLKILKPDRKLSIIEVDVTLTDESLAKDFTNNIVSVVNSFYIQTKTKKLLKNVQVLQLQADSIRNVLNNSIYGVANAADASPNANPLLSVLKAPIQKKQIDVQVSTGVYAEVLKNLELTKIQLRNETPLIQNIDSPILPLQVIRLGGLKGMMVGFFLGLVISALGVLLRGYLTNKLTIN